MHHAVVSLLSFVVLAGCARTPAPVEAAAPAVAPAVADAPPTPATVGGEPCWNLPHERGPQPQYLPDSPVGVLVRFYEQLQPISVKSVPDVEELAVLRPLLTRPLIAALERAQVERDAAASAAPGDKPPYLDGAMFVSLFEGYTELQPITVATEGWEARVRVCFAYADDSGRSEWTDTVVLRKEDGVWRIDDVVYGGQWDFANTGTLRESLPKQP